MRTSDAWFLLAERFAASRRDFLCWALGDNPGQRPLVPTIPRARRKAMVRHIWIVVGAVGSSAYTRSSGPMHGLSDISAEAHEARVLACLMFGWEARDKERPA